MEFHNNVHKTAAIVGKMWLDYDFDWISVVFKDSFAQALFQYLYKQNKKTYLPTSVILSRSPCRVTYNSTVCSSPVRGSTTV